MHAEVVGFRTDHAHVDCPRSRGTPPSVSASDLRDVLHTTHVVCSRRSGWEFRLRSGSAVAGRAEAARDAVVRPGQGGNHAPRIYRQSCFRPRMVGSSALRGGSLAMVVRRSTGCCPRYRSPHRRVSRFRRIGHLNCDIAETGPVGESRRGTERLEPDAVCQSPLTAVCSHR